MDAEPSQRRLSIYDTVGSHYEPYEGGHKAPYSTHHHPRPYDAIITLLPRWVKSLFFLMVLVSHVGTRGKAICLHLDGTKWRHRKSCSDMGQENLLLDIQSYVDKFVDKVVDNQG